ncbi:MAG: putative zinc-binding protein [Candidatus Omnitrophica bacterium]|nr:putative zinc-binding protein [Candidatus Omnitrophota bacterium]
MSAKCDCGGVCTLVFPCSGGADVGALSDSIARKMSKDQKAKMFCLAGIGAHIPGMIESAKSAKNIISIDGCPVMCAKKTLEHAGFTPESYSLKDFGFEKGKTDVSNINLDEIISKILEREK